MLFSLFNSAPLAPASVAASAAIKCLLAYTHGLEDCLIDVEVADGVVTLTGTASSEPMARHAASIAANFTASRVICSLQITSQSALD
jgi:osmotically-inducible protein OsmY